MNFYVHATLTATYSDGFEVDAETKEVAVELAKSMIEDLYDGGGYTVAAIETEVNGIEQVNEEA